MTGTPRRSSGKNLMSLSCFGSSLTHGSTVSFVTFLSFHLSTFPSCFISGTYTTCTSTPRSVFRNASPSIATASCLVIFASVTSSSSSLVSDSRPTGFGSVPMTKRRSFEECRFGTKGPSPMRDETLARGRKSSRAMGQRRRRRRSGSGSGRCACVHGFVEARRITRCRKHDRLHRPIPARCILVHSAPDRSWRRTRARLGISPRSSSTQAVQRPPTRCARGWDLHRE
mmetsp:Transcript_8154/g.50515  ORF Transcript_8154/g.50515 Transcript_8154/m.50515 type:complete len:228 (+) Transcript_8154:2547-3230(+)